MGITIRRGASLAAAALTVVTTGVWVTKIIIGTSSADPVGHQVTYKITSEIEQYASIAFIANQPANETDYADNSQKYLFTVRPKVNPDAPWSYTTTLADPGRWAWLSAGDFYAFEDFYLPRRVASIDHGYRCEIAIDGRVVVSNRGSLDVGCGTKPTDPPALPKVERQVPSPGDLRSANGNE
jgi:hypothetical protein